MFVIERFLNAIIRTSKAFNPIKSVYFSLWYQRGFSSSYRNIFQANSYHFRRNYSAINMLSADSNVLALFRELHANPEPSGREFKTAKLCTQFFQEHIPKAKIHHLKNSTGMMVELPSQSKANADKTAVVRVDMDAVPVNGISHACGHDVHMSIGAQFALELVSHPLKKGRVFLLYQPAEENAEGAKQVLQDPVFQLIVESLPNKPYFFALHNLPGFKNNQIVLSQTQAFSSAVISRRYKIKGNAAHAANPEFGNNPIMPIVKIINDLPTITQVLASMSILAKITVVHVAVGKNWNGGTSPGDGELCVTFRAHDNQKLSRVLEMFSQRMRDALSVGKFRYESENFDYFPATENSKELVALLAAQAKGNVAYIDSPFSWGEDFGYFLKKYTGIMFGFGAGENNADLHNETYQSPVEIIKPAAEVFARLIRHVLYYQHELEEKSDFENNIATHANKNYRPS